MAYRIREFAWREALDLRPEDLMTMSEAARLLNVQIGTIEVTMERGQLTMVENPDSVSRNQGRRLLLRSEVEAKAAAKAAKTGKRRARRKRIPHTRGGEPS